MHWKRCLPLILLSAIVLLAPVKITAQEKKAPTLPDGAKVERDLAYGPHKERNVLDLYVPKADGPLPLIIWIHGGGWTNGSKANPWALGMLSKGYAVASINYRLSQHAIYPAQIEDCKAAVRFLRANAKKYNLDPDHFGAWGASAGGHLVALLGTTADVKELEGKGDYKEVSSRVQAVCNWFGPSDFLTFKSQQTEVKAFDAEAKDSPLSKLLGGPASETKDNAKKASPVTYVSKTSAPILILHGDKDKVVPWQQSQQLHDALKAAGAESTLILIKDGEHGKGVGTPEHAKMIDEFFDKHLKAKK